MKPSQAMSFGQGHIANNYPGMHHQTILGSCQNDQVGRPCSHLLPWAHQSYDYLQSNHQ